MPKTLPGGMMSKKSFSLFFMETSAATEQFTQNKNTSQGIRILSDKSRKIIIMAGCFRKNSNGI